MPANLENSAMAIGLEKVIFIPIPKGNAKECSNYCTIALISQASKVMLKNPSSQASAVCEWRELPDIQAGFRKGRQRRQWHPTPVLCLENPMDRGAWQAAVHGVAEGGARLSDFIFTFHFHALEKEMATHSSILAQRIPGTGEPSGLPSMGLHRVRRDLAAAAEESEIKLPTSTGSQKKQGNFKKTSTSASLTMLQPLTVWIKTNCGIFLKRWEYQTTLPAS